MMVLPGWLGCTREEVENLLKEGRWLEEALIPADRVRFETAWRERAPKGEPVNLVYRCAAQNGDVYWVHLSAIRIREEGGCPVYYAIFTQPSDEVLLYRTLVEESVTATFVAEKTGRRILYVNAAWRALEGISEEEKALGETLYSLITDDQHLLTQQEIEKLPSSTFYRFHAKRADGPAKVRLLRQRQAARVRRIQAKGRKFHHAQNTSCRRRRSGQPGNS